jgi:glycosyltransferase involved in cell wall biosynthesis
MSLPVTIVIPTLNEAEQIADCVRQVSWADETIVADAGSTDGTVALARQAGAVVLERTGPTIAAQRNAAIARARNAWVFALDADERFTPDLREELAVTLSGPRHRAYRVRRRNFYLGSELRRGHWGRDWVTRLFSRECRWRERRVHETLEFEGESGMLRGALLHSPYRSLAHQLEKMNRYALWGAQDLYDSGRRASAWDICVRPLGRFVRAYLLQGAIFDGRFGLVASTLGAYTGFLKYAHLWALEQRRVQGGAVTTSSSLPEPPPAAAAPRE